VEFSKLVVEFGKFSAENCGP